jgi:rare lipoprotein A
MMKKHFGSVFVTASAIVLALSGAALAHTATRADEPSQLKSGAAWSGESGTASYYGVGFNGRPSASGARYNQMALTAAHHWLPFGTKVKVTLAGTGRTVVVTITDRLYQAGRVVDLSVAAARQLGMINRGIATVSLLPV